MDLTYTCIICTYKHRYINICVYIIISLQYNIFSVNTIYEHVIYMHYIEALCPLHISFHSGIQVYVHMHVYVIYLYTHIHVIYMSILTYFHIIC